MTAPLTLGAIISAEAKWVVRDRRGEVSAVFSGDDEGHDAAIALASKIGGSALWEMGQ